MKYAIVNQRGGINRVFETEPKHTPEGVSIVEITDQQYDLVIAGREATLKVHYFLIADELKTLSEKQVIAQAERLASLPYYEARQIAYAQEGITPEALTIALTEKVAENRPEALDELQAKRLAIKVRFPKA